MLRGCGFAVLRISALIDATKRIRHSPAVDAADARLLLQRRTEWLAAAMRLGAVADILPEDRLALALIERLRRLLVDVVVDRLDIGLGGPFGTREGQRVLTRLRMAEAHAGLGELDAVTAGVIDPEIIAEVADTKAKVRFELDDLRVHLLAVE